jgi:predicted RND superfamily exporter protein
MYFASMAGARRIIQCVVRYCAFVWRRPLAILAIALLASALLAGSASRLELRTNLAELLPSADPAVRELRRVGDRLSGTLVLDVVVESPDRQANLRCAAALAARLERLPRTLVESVLPDVRAERAFFSAHRWLYADLATLEALRDALRARIAQAKNPLLVEIEEPEPLESIARRLRQAAAAVDRFPSGYFEGEQGRLIVLVVRPAGRAFGEHVGEALRAAAERIIEEVRPASFHPEMRVGLTGDLIVTLDERAGLERDLVRASSVCIALVCLAVALFFGRLRAVPLVAVPALIGVAAAFGLAQLAFGFVNLASAFMGSIVVGNGINFAIIQQARYQEERRAGAPALEAAATALRATSGATLVAALAAAAAYGSLALTRFRGFSQFGALGAAGMLVAWLATVTVLPALWALFDRQALPGRARRLGLGRGRASLWIAALLTIAAALPLPRYLKDPFQYDLSRLRNRPAHSDAAALSARIAPIFGQTLAPLVILAEQRAQAIEIRDRIRARARDGEGRRLIAAVRTLDDFLPGSDAEQRRKLLMIDEIRPLLAELQIDELAPPAALSPIGEADLPASIRQAFAEADGTLGRLVLVYDDERWTTSDGRSLIRLAELIGEIPLADGTSARCPIVFAAMIRGIGHDAPIATGLSLLAVVLLVVVLARRGAPLVIGALLVGVLWVLGAVAWLGVKINFLNFIALPITFGIGVDYGINIVRRHQLDGRLGGTGGAVALCSLTTIIGYGALLAADNQALSSFGAVAILGEIASLLAALALLPALLDRR